MGRAQGKDTFSQVLGSRRGQSLHSPISHPTKSLKEIIPDLAFSYIAREVYDEHKDFLSSYLLASGIKSQYAEHLWLQHGRVHIRPHAHSSYALCAWRDEYGSMHGHADHMTRAARGTWHEPERYDLERCPSCERKFPSVTDDWARTAKEEMEETLEYTALYQNEEEDFIDILEEELEETQVVSVPDKNKRPSLYRDAYRRAVLRWALECTNEKTILRFAPSLRRFESRLPRRTGRYSMLAIDFDQYLGHEKIYELYSLCFPSLDEKKVDWPEFQETLTRNFSSALRRKLAEAELAAL